MKIAFVNRKDCLEHRGGDTVQMLLTKEYLEKNFPVKIDICLSKEEINNEYDLIHIFNIQNYEESYEYIQTANKLGIKTVVSTIYWDLNHVRYLNIHYKLFNSEKYLNNCFINYIIKVICFIFMKFRIQNWKQILKTRKILLEADCLLPNSDEELKIVAKDFYIGFNKLKMKSISIPNAVKENVKQESNIQKISFENYVLMVGRIESIKNQLSVVKALMEYPQIPIVIIGRISDNTDNAYINELKYYSNKRGNVHYISEIPHNKINDYYKKATVHVLASFRESPGLVSLEALQNGCEIVVSDENYCPIKYYKFNTLGHICNPFDILSIKNAILEAYQIKKNNADEKYFQFFSYENAAKLTYESYLKVMEDNF